MNNKFWPKVNWSVTGPSLLWSNIKSLETNLLVSYTGFHSGKFCTSVNAIFCYHASNVTIIFKGKQSVGRLDTELTELSKPNLSIYLKLNTEPIE